MIKVNNNIRIDLIVVAIIIIIHWSLMIVLFPFGIQKNSKCGNPDFEHFKHLKNSGHLLLTVPSNKCISGHNNLVPTLIRPIIQTPPTKPQKNRRYGNKYGIRQ